MKLETIKQFIDFLTPGLAEDLNKEARTGNASWQKLGKSIKLSRNAVYFGAAFAIIGAIGLAASGVGTLPMIAFSAILIVSLVITAIALKILYNKTLEYEKK